MALFVLALVLIAYSGSFSAQFHLDDIGKVQENPAIRDIGNIPRFFYPADGDYPLTMLEFRPLKYASLALNYYLFGIEPWSYHLFNLLLHIINCLLLFTAVRLVAKAGGSDDRSSSVLAFVSASVFALHPLQTGTVMYLSNGRSVMLAAMFTLLGFISYVKFREEGRDGRTGYAVYAYGTLSLVFYMLGLLSKEIAVTLPAIVIAYDYLVCGRAAGGIKGVIKRVPWYASFLAVLAIFLAWKQAVHGYAVVREAPYPAADYLMSEAKVFLLYLRLAVLPVNLNADYQLPLTTAVDPSVLMGLAAFAASLVLMYVYRKKEPVAVFFGFWFIVMLLPESSVVSFREIAVEYRMYLPLAGLTAAAASIVIMKARVTAGDRKVATGLFAVILVLFSVMCYWRVAVWQTETSYWRDVVAKSPWSGRAHSNLGRALLINKSYDEAISELTRSLEVDPGYLQVDVTLFNLGMCYYEQGDMETAAGYFESAIIANPSYVESYRKLGDAYGFAGRHEDAIHTLGRALELGGHDENTERNLATALLMSGQEDRAKAFLEDLIEKNYDSFYARYYLALICFRQGDVPTALEHARRSLEMAADEDRRSMAASLIEELGG